MARRPASYLGLLGGDAVHSEAALHVVDQAEVLARLFDADHICKRETTQMLGKRSCTFQTADVMYAIQLLEGGKKEGKVKTISAFI